MSPSLKKEKQQISLWLNMSFHRENQKCNSQTLMYKITLGKSLSFESILEKVIQSGWLGVSTKLFPSSLKELEID